jgi:hypothetical protein
MRSGGRCHPSATVSILTSREGKAVVLCEPCRYWHLAKCSATFLAKFFPLGRTNVLRGEFPASSKQEMKPFQKLGRDFKSTFWLVPIMGWTTGLFFKVSIMG